ncbi:MAG: SIS domain-containing protein [Rhodopseudomonas palustris]|nr:SIS domain-containing protein [Rhodopseudomonas palustris]
MIGARKAPPLAIGYGDGEMYLGSRRAGASSPFTDTISYLEDGDWAVLTARRRRDPRRRRRRSVERKRADRASSELAGRQGQLPPLHGRRRSTSSPRWSADTLARYVDMATERDGAARRAAVRSSRRSSASRSSACGTAYYAGLVAKYWFEQLARLPVEVDVASEFRYREAAAAPRRRSRSSISQSGETADTLAALRYAKEQGAAHVVGRSTCRPRPSPARATAALPHPRRARDRRGLHQGLHPPADGAGCAGGRSSGGRAARCRTARRGRAGPWPDRSAAR